MDVDATLTAAETLLRQRGADQVAHPGGTLLEHLHRVRRQLDDWDATPEVQVAGSVTPATEPMGSTSLCSSSTSDRA